MAVNRDPNSILAHFSGKLGGFIIKNYGNKTVLSAIPDMSRRKLSPKQKEANQLMKFANKYAKKIIADPANKAAAAKILDKHMNQVYHALVADFIIKKGDSAKLIKLPSKKSAGKK